MKTTTIINIIHVTGAFIVIISALLKILHKGPAHLDSILLFGMMLGYFSASWTSIVLKNEINKLKQNK